ncbi:MAG TPA: polysaccharide pyruvyl transferase family protein [Terriglobales bacterium]|jgi:polysaccharide pyruvyl transferase WcaK-like protein
MANGSTTDREPRLEGRQRIALLHHTGCGNLGDDAIIDAVVANVRRRWASAGIAVFSMNPEDTVKRHGIQSFPARNYEWESSADPAKGSPPARSRFLDWLGTTRNPIIRMPRAAWSELCWLVRSYRRLRSFDLLIVSGGGQLTERGGPWSFPFSLFVWAQMARMAGVRLVFGNVGAGPLNHPLSKWFIIRALRAASYVSFRNKESQELVASLGFTRTSHVFPDNAYGLELGAPAVLRHETRKMTVGIAPMPFPFSDLLTVPQNADEIESELVDKLVAFTRLLATGSYSVTLFGSDVKADPPLVSDIHKQLISRHNVVVPFIMPSKSVSELLSHIAKMDYVVTCRFHGVVFSHLLNKPVLAIAHHPKVSQLMNALGLSEYCVDMRTFDPEDLARRFASLVASTDAVKARLAGSLADYRGQLAMQWDALFPPQARPARMKRSRLRDVAL